MNTMSLLVFDGLLLFSIVSLAWATLTSSDERLSVILFMAFGLVLAVAWGRLLAPDVALAEAAIGAGLTGALLLAAVRGQPRPLSPGATHASRKQGAAGVTVVLRLVVTLGSARRDGRLGRYPSCRGSGRPYP